MGGRREGYATGVVAALVAERVYTSTLDRGIFHIEQLFEPSPFLKRVAGYGFTVEPASPRNRETGLTET